MSSPSPIAAGFSLVFRRPSLIFAEIAWRWSFAAAAWFLGAMFLIAYAGSVPVNTLDSVMWHSGQPALIGRALRHILAGSGFRFTIGGILLALCLLVGWIVLASLGRVAIVRNAANELGVSTHSDRGRVRPLLLLNFLRAAVALAAIVALVGSVLLASSYWASTHVRAGEAGRMVTLLWFLIWGCWISVNWVLSFASLFAPVEGGVAVAFATVARLLADKTGAVFLIGVVFGFCHFGIFVAGCGAGLMELGLLGTSVAPAVVLLEILTGAAYCAVADFLYTGRMVAYLSLLRREEPQARARETSARRSPEAGSIDKGEVILSDVPLLPALVCIRNSDLRNSFVETQSIVVLDFGAQYSQLIARRVREQNVFSVVLPCNSSIEQIRKHNPIGIILSGGPSSVYDKDAPAADPHVFELDVPVLGICYGLQFMAHALGGKVKAAKHREYGHAQVSILEESQLFRELPRFLEVWMSHGDEALELPAGFKLIAKSPTAVAAIENAGKRLFAVQFHPEVRHTKLGTEILRNFVLNICKAKPTWTPQHFVDATVAAVREQVGSGRAICALSGGVDSAVAAVLVDRALREDQSPHPPAKNAGRMGQPRLTCVFVNNGVLRKNEFEKVQQNLRDKLGLHLVAVDATERFLTTLAGVTDPEKKRKIIGNEFIAVFDEEAHRIAKSEGEVAWLVQGTLYPDVIESVSVRGPSQVIKSHHNVGGLPEKMKLKLIEPLKELFKDEVRRIGRDMGMPEEILQRQPFPGPGLAVRVLGEVTPERLAILRECDDIVVNEIKTAGLYTKIWQSFAVLLPVMSVGVMGDQRTYAYTCAIRAVHSDDGMTADWVPLPHEVLKTISSRIVNEVRGINRVVYDITSKPPGTIEWE